MVEIRVLKYFLMVAREENITKAAQLLHIDRGVRFPISLRQPKADRLAAQGIHAGKQSPNITADFFTVGKVVLRLDSPFHNDFSIWFLQHLNKYALQFFHVEHILSQRSEFDSIGEKKRDRNRMFGIFAGITAELFVKSSLVAVHTSKP